MFSMILWGGMKIGAGGNRFVLLLWIIIPFQKVIPDSLPLIIGVHLVWSSGT